MQNKNNRDFLEITISLTCFCTIDACSFYKIDVIYIRIIAMAK